MQDFVNAGVATSIVHECTHMPVFMYQAIIHLTYNYQYNVYQKTGEHNKLNNIY